MHLKTENIPIPFSSEEEKNNENGKKMDVDSLWLNNRKKNITTMSPICGQNAFPRRSTDYTILY